MPSPSSRANRPGGRAPADTTARLLADALGFPNKGQPSAARELARKVLRRDPSHRDARHLMAMIEFEDGDIRPLRPNRSSLAP